MKKAVSTVYFLLIACCTATVAAITLGFYLELEPAYAASEVEEDMFFCGTVNDEWGYTDIDADSVLLEKHITGRTLFDNNCRACHEIHSVVVGPALAGVTARRDSAWLHSFITNSGGLVAAGDSTAIQVYKDYNRQQMPSFNMSTTEIDAILAYIALYPTP